jgi:hypothetical protein
MRQLLGEVSDEFECTMGVRQGESLSPFLFSLFLNDLEETLVQGNHAGLEFYHFRLLLLLYADGVALFSESRSGLQEGLDLLHDYCTRWKLTVNVEKTEIVVFRRGGQLSMDGHFFFGDKRLVVNNLFSYLGLTFTSNGKFTRAQKELADKARRAMFKLFRELYDPKPGFMCSLFDKLILPILLYMFYSSEVWGFHPGPDVEKVHLQFCKRLLHVKNSTANYFVYGELRRHPLSVYRHLRILKYWLTIVMRKPNSLVHTMYRELYRQAELNVNCGNWAGLVKQLLYDLGFGRAWMQQGVGCSHSFLALCKQRLTDQFITRWNTQMNNSTDALFYREVKSVLEYSAYISWLTVPRYRYSFEKFLTKNSKLPVVVGKWHRPRPYHERLCEECGSLGDEYHFLLVCKQFKKLRKQYSSIFLEVPLGSKMHNV